MSDNPQQRRNGELKVCDDVWLAVSTTEWALAYLAVHRSEEDGTGAQIVISKGDSIKRLPIPQGPPPAKLIGFKYMEICYIDATVIAFLRHIRRLFDAGITLQMEIPPGADRSWDIFVQEIWPLLSSNINELLPADCLHELRSRISPTVLCDCANLQSICSRGLPTPEFPADDRREASDGQAMTKWIHTPREDGLPKTFQFLGDVLLNTMVNGFRETFLNASTAVNYIIVLNGEEAPADYVPFDLKNEQTGERLAFRRLSHDAWLMERGLIVRDEKQWTEWKKEALKGIRKNVIVFFIDEES
uniref:Uncharacterized protein n=1 Tax=Globodera pallida TaxID=36090 RepID=A0A183C2V8_GLOPA